jgi:mono/diheme cytochrome c family protein
VLRRIAAAVELVVAVAVIVTVVLLFTNQPTAPPPARAVAGGVDGADVFARNCAGCHGGDGSGGIGPRLSGGRVVEHYPDPADQIAVVTYGRDGMPTFGGRLTDAEIAAVVEYTRTVLAGSPP